jgi:hypothetical protein
VWERTVKETGCVQFCTSESILGSLAGSVLENVLEVYLRASYELTCQCIVKHVGSVT